MIEIEEDTIRGSMSILSLPTPLVTIASFSLPVIEEPGSRSLTCGNV